MEETIKLTGHIKLQLFGPDGKLKQEFEKQNLVVNVGKTYLTGFLAANPQTGTFMPYIGVGTGTAIPTVTDTTLQSPLPTRVAGTLTNSSNTWNNNTTFPAGVDTGLITEAGLFSASSGGTMFARQVFIGFNKQVGDSFVVSWTVSFS
jgi:hypothetical protein